MNRQEWQEVEAAAALLGLGETATLEDIKAAYHRLSRKFHPDLATNEAARQRGEQEMYRITAAYSVLKRYCGQYRFPLKAPTQAKNTDIYDPQDWWQTRFGQDPVWGGNKK